MALRHVSKEEKSRRVRLQKGGTYSGCPARGGILNYRSSQRTFRSESHYRIDGKQLAMDVQVFGGSCRRVRRGVCFWTSAWTRQPMAERRAARLSEHRRFALGEMQCKPARAILVLMLVTWSDFVEVKRYFQALVIFDLSLTVVN